MRKYVLNIEKLYTGQTANAIVLKQVDETFPTLLPPIPDGVTVDAWVARCRTIHPEFNPPIIGVTPDELNGKIVDFNLELQQSFKDSGHDELYMMDETWQMKPDGFDNTATGKTYLHSLNGRHRTEDEEGREYDVNASQLNVMFPFRKFSNKSMYASTLKIQDVNSIDQRLELARGVTLQGKVSYEKCVQAVASVGNNLYSLAPSIALENHDTLNGNGMTIVNGHRLPYHFPQSMTLFQPCGDQYKNAVDPFVEWYDTHNRTTVVTLEDEYGGSVSNLGILGPSSYVVSLATYSPTGLVIDDKTIPFDTSTFNAIRAGTTSIGRYKKNKGEESGKYVIYERDVEHERDYENVGFMFNLYDTFVTGKERTLHVTIPVDKDFNDLKFKFKCDVRRSQFLSGEMETIVYIGDKVVYGDDEHLNPNVEYLVTKAAIEEHELDIKVLIHYEVDFGKRNSEKEYQDALRESGVALMNIVVENGVSDGLKHLTWGSYVNEQGIDENTRNERYEQFWTVSQYVNDISYQTVLESPMRNVIGNGITRLHNYSTGDIYGDVFVTKSVLDPQYDMNIQMSKWDDALDDWGVSNGSLRDVMHMVGRDYIGLGQCSNQLSLFYKPTNVAVRIDDDDTIVTRRQKYEESDLRYQMVEVVKNLNRFESSIKHKSNVFSVVVSNSNLEPSTKDESEMSEDEKVLEKYKKQLRYSVTQFVRNTCESIVPVHTQLFDVQFT